MPASCHPVSLPIHPPRSDSPRRFRSHLDVLELASDSMVVSSSYKRRVSPSDCIGAALRQLPPPYQRWSNKTIYHLWSSLLASCATLVLASAPYHCSVQCICLNILPCHRPRRFPRHHPYLLCDKTYFMMTSA